jgi:glycosyltransferase involved in cell wall biosynthesis
LTIGIVSASDTAGGAEAHTVALGRGLRSRGHDVVLYGRCPGWDEAGMPHQPLRLGPKWSRRTLVGGLLRTPAERRRARAILGRSVFHLQFKREQVVLSGPLSGTAPVVWTEHGRWMQGNMGRVLLRAYARASRNVAKVVCVSGAVADDIRQVVDPRKIVVVPNAIDAAAYAITQQMRDRARADLLPASLRDRTVAVLVSRLHPAKGHHRAVQVAVATGTPLVVVGDGPDRARLERLAAGSPDIVFVGHQRSVRDWLAAADLYVYCGAGTDGTPAAVLEAAASGLPVVGFQGDPGTELIKECGGVVVADPDDLTPDLIASVAREKGAGVTFVRREHGLETWLDAYEGIFGECAA